jgi:DNA gyrase/topoisomerase IV subunit A
VDDDFLEPNSGEIWLAVNAIGVSNCTTDGNYWLEKKVGSGWSRLGDENQMASWGDETIKLSGKTAVCQVDWSDVYGELDAGVYRMGKHFYNGSESIIQYAEFAIYQTGGVFGEGAEAALARVDEAIEKLEQSNYHVEKYGEVASLSVVSKDDDVIIISANGVIIRIKADYIRQCARPSKGVTVMKVKDDNEVVTVAAVPHEDEETDEVENAEVENTETTEETNTTEATE